MKHTKLIKITLLSVFCATTATSFGAAISQNKKGRASRDLGSILIQVQVQNNNASGRIDWSGGNLRGGKWQSRWDVKRNQVFLTCGKHFKAGSRGYPKTLSRVNSSKRAKYNSRVRPGVRMRGRWQTGAYVWLDNNRAGLGTHELNIWNRPYSRTRSFTRLGQLSEDGSTYLVYRFRNRDGFQSWVLPRQKSKLGMNIRFAQMAKTIRGRWKMPNHEIINVLLAQEGHQGSKGHMEHSRFSVADL